jgi:hypothetical protein
MICSLPTSDLLEEFLVFLYKKMKIFIVAEICNEPNPDDVLGQTKLFISEEKAQEFFKTTESNEYSVWQMWSKETED